MTVIFRENESLLTPSRKRSGRGQGGALKETWNFFSSLLEKVRSPPLRRQRRHRRSLRGLRRMRSSARSLMSRVRGEMGGVGRRFLRGLSRIGSAERAAHQQLQRYPVDDHYPAPQGGAARHPRGQSYFGQQQGEIIFEDELFGFRTRVRLVDRQVGREGADTEKTAHRSCHAYKDASPLFFRVSLARWASPATTPATRSTTPTSAAASAAPPSLPPSRTSASTVARPGRTSRRTGRPSAGSNSTRTDASRDDG